MNELKTAEHSPEIVVCSRCKGAGELIVASRRFRGYEHHHCNLCDGKGFRKIVNKEDSWTTKKQSPPSASW